jgi:hypothetical protein
MFLSRLPPDPWHWPPHRPSVLWEDKCVKSGGCLSKIRAILVKPGLDLTIQAEQTEQLRLEIKNWGLTFPLLEGVQ